MENPYLEAAKGGLQWLDLAAQRSFDGFLLREQLTPWYAWAIPNEEAVKRLIACGPIVELGAGTGYWAWCVRQLGGDIIAYDIRPYNNHWCGAKGTIARCMMHKDSVATAAAAVVNGYQRPWTEVLQGGTRSLAQHRDRTLFLCWPPYKSAMAANALRWHRSERVVFVGEDAGGATGDSRFHKRLEEDFKEVDCVTIPQWQGMYDRMVVYERQSRDIAVRSPRCVEVE